MARILSLLQAGKHTDLTSFFSTAFLGFYLPLCLIFYALVPRKLKKYALLLESLSFFWLISGNRIVWLLGTVLIVWGCGLWMDAVLKKRDAELAAAERPRRKEIKRRYQGKLRWILALGALANLGVLLTLKYAGFALRNVNALFGLTLNVPKYLMPIGISFYTLQAIAYLFDVYHEKISADRNLLRVALFLSFFPQIVEGPICRYSETADRLWNCEPIRYENLTAGLQRLLFGLMKKLVVADRLNTFVKAVFADSGSFSGGVIGLAALCYTVQLYMDFSGSMDAVVGVGQIFGISMPENFRRPFFSRTISEFWNRWHITLGTFFRDYIFYPVTMSKPMKKLTNAARKKLGNHFGPLLAGSVALFCVWFANGVWHGAAWSFIFFGMYHFALILTGSLIAPLVKKTNDRLHISPEHPVYRGLQIFRACVLVVIGELFFRADGLREGMRMFGKMVTDFRFTGFFAQTAEISFDRKDALITAITVLIVFAVSLMNEKGICLRAEIAKKPVALRWAIWYTLILYILIFGAYGPGYVPVDPMYANF